MKKVLVLGMAFALSGCAIYDAITMAKFDNHEYALVNDIRSSVVVVRPQCGTSEEKPLVQQLYVQSLTLKNYSQYIPKNDPTIKMTSELHEIIQGLHNKYQGQEPVSAAYCNLKLNLIEKNAEVMQRSIGGKPR
jgi:hypothetical protein